MAIKTYISVITVSVDGLNTVIKGHRVASWIIHRPFSMLPTGDSLQGKTHTDWKGMDKDAQIETTRKRR